MMIELRPLIESDVLEIDRIWRLYWQGISSMPNRNNAIVDAVVTSDNQVIAYGQAKLFAEAMLFLDASRSKRERAIATKLLMNEARRGVRAVGIEEMYAFIKDPMFAKLISNRYGFTVVDDPGQLLLGRV